MKTDRTINVALAVLIVVIGVEIAYYPWISAWIFGVFTGRGWDGSALRYYQMFYVLPGGLVVAAVLTTCVLLICPPISGPV